MSVANNPTKIVIAIRDIKAQRCLEPMFLHNARDASRMAGVILKNKTMAMHHYPEEFECVHLADWYESGELISKNKVMFNLSELVEKKDEVKK